MHEQSNALNLTMTIYGQTNITIKLHIYSCHPLLGNPNPNPNPNPI